MCPCVIRRSEVKIGTGAELLDGTLALPPKPRGVIVFAHGSGSSRNSPRNNFVSELLLQAGFGTLVFDLLTETEGWDRRNVFDVELLAGRLLAATRSVMTAPETSELPVGLYGASTGAAAALVVAAQEPAVRAVVSRGGRPDLAEFWLDAVRAPTLLIVGSRDQEVLALNRQALARLTCEKRLAIVQGAPHLFETPGALENAAVLTRDWFTKHLMSAAMQWN